MVLTIIALCSVVIVAGTRVEARIMPDNTPVAAVEDAQPAEGSEEAIVEEGEGAEIPEETEPAAEEKIAFSTWLYNLVKLEKGSTVANIIEYSAIGTLAISMLLLGVVIGKPKAPKAIKGDKPPRHRHGHGKRSRANFEQPPAKQTIKF